MVSFTSDEIFSFTSFPGKEEQKTASLGIPTPIKKSNSISVMLLSIERWLMNTLLIITESDIPFMHDLGVWAFSLMDI